MENISITTYRGLSLVSGSISIRQMFEFIRGDVYRDRIRRLREAMDAGETVKADHMKKQLHHHGYLRQGKAGLQSGQVSGHHHARL